MKKPKKKPKYTYTPGANNRPSESSGREAKLEREKDLLKQVGMKQVKYP